MKKRSGFIGIVIDDRQKSAEKVNQLLSQFGHIVIARTGIPYHNRNCCVITLVVEATMDEVGELTGKIGNLPGTTVKSALSKET